MPTDQERAAREWLTAHHPAYALPVDVESLARLIVDLCTEAVEAARPEVERKAKIEALDGLMTLHWDCDCGNLSFGAIKDEIARLRAEGGKNG